MKQKFKHKTLGLNIGLVAIYFILLSFIPHITLEPITQKVAVFMSQSFFKIPFIQFGLKDYNIVNFIYGFLSTNFSSINWYPLSFFILQAILTIISIFFLVQKSYIPKRIPIVIQCIFSIVILLLLFTHQVFLEHNNTSLLYGGLGVLFMIFQPFFSFWYLLGFLFSILSLLYRPEALTGVFIVTIPYLLLFRTKMWKHDLKKMSPIFILFIAFQLLFIYKTTFSKDFYYQLEPDFEYELMDKGNIIPISEMKSLSDSAKYDMVNAWLLCDPDTITADFIRSLIKDKENSLSKFDFISAYVNKQNVISPLLKAINSFEFYLLVLFILTITFSFKRKKTFILKSAFYIFYILLVIVFVVAGIDTNLERLFFKTILTIVAFNFLFDSISGNRFQQKSNLAHPILLFILLFSLFIYKREILSSIGKNKTEVDKNINNLQIVQKQKQRIIIYMGGHDILNCHNSVVQINSIFGDKKIIDFRMAQYYDTDNHREILSKVIDIPNPKYLDILKFIQNHIDDIIVIGSPDIMEVWQTYNFTIYEYRFDYSRIATEFDSFGNYIYTLRNN